MLSNRLDLVESILNGGQGSQTSPLGSFILKGTKYAYYSR